METLCQKCGAGLAAGQAFCPKCGAVVGMSAAAPRHGEGWDMAATVVGQQLPPAAMRPRPSAERPSQAAQTAQVPAVPTGSNVVLLAVIGFVAVLAIAGLVILLLYLNSQG